MSHSFKLENNSNKSNKIKSDYSLFYMIAFIIIAIVCFVVYFIMINNNPTISVSKNDVDKSYVYTAKKEKSKNEDTYNKIPAINLKGSKYEQLNTDIMEQYEKVSANDNFVDYTYEFNQSDDILSLVTEYTYYPEKSVYPIIHYNTYNIDLSKDQILTEDQLLDRYNVERKQIQVYLEAKFKLYYKEIVANGFYTKKQCDYDCFLKNRGITENYLDNTSLYVDKGDLTLFKYFYFDSTYDERQYFKDFSYQFLIKKR